MHRQLASLVILTLATVGATALAASIPPGRQHRLVITGENTITFVPQLNMPDVKVDYQAKFEYIVDSRYGKEPKPAATETKEPDKDDDDPADPNVAKTAKKSRSKAKKGETPGSQATGAIDVSLHSSERLFRQNGQPLVEMKVSRSKFQGRTRPEMPAVSVTAANAPAPLLEIMKGFDVTAASLLLNDDLKVLNRKYFRAEGAPQRAIVETMLSIHTPLPRNADSWEAFTQIVMGQGQTAKGNLRFEKIQPPPIKKQETDKNKDKVPPKEVTRVNVKVSGTLKAEGIVAERFIKDGTYTVTGEQTFDLRTHDWITSRWTVVVDNELANPNGQTIARAKGTMTLESRTVDGTGPNETEKSGPKL